MIFRPRRRRLPSRSGDRLRSVVAPERLEGRALLAISAYVDTITREFVIALGQEGDRATLVVDQQPAPTGEVVPTAPPPPITIYRVSGTGISAPFTVPASIVDAILVSGKAGGQAFILETGNAIPLDDPLTVESSIDSTSIYGAIDTLGVVSIGSPSIVLGANVRAIGGQSYTGSVLIDGDITVDAGQGPITFAAPIDGIGAERFRRGETGTLSVLSSAETRLEGPIGGQLALAGLVTDPGGTTTIAAGNVTTAGAAGQSYGDPVTFATSKITGSDAFLATGGGPVQFGGTVDGAVALRISAGAGTVSFGKAVGVVAPLSGLVVTSAAGVTGHEPINLDGGATGSLTNGVTIAGGVHNVQLDGGGTVQRFMGRGIVFEGGSIGSVIRGFTITSNRGGGMLFGAGDYTGTVVAGNSITANGDTEAATGDGIRVLGAHLLIGGAGNQEPVVSFVPPPVANVISGSVQAGITVSGPNAFGVSILSNQICLNGVADPRLTPPGIKLENGGNGGQVAPTILSGVIDENAGVVRVTLSIPGADTATYRVQVFSNPASDALTEGPVDPTNFEGRSFLAEATGFGAAPRVLEIPLVDVAAGDWLTATATAFDGSTSAFSTAVQAEVGQTQTPDPVFAAGSDGSATVWEREFAYVAVGAKTIRIAGLSRAQAGFFPARMPLAVTPADAPATIATQVVASRYDARLRAAIVTLDKPVPRSPGFGTLVLGSGSAPGARLVEATTGNIRREVFAADLFEAGYTNAFATRFQGGMRAAAADVDGNGHADLFVAPGGVPDKADPTRPSRSLAAAFGASLHTVALFDGAPEAGWGPVSIDVGAVFGALPPGGLFVTTGDVRADGAGSARLELIVASATRLAVFDILVAEPGARPEIAPLPLAVFDAAPKQSFTGIATGRLFDSGEFEQIVAAATTATPRAGGATTVTVLDGPTFAPLRTLPIASFVESGPARKVVDVYARGASVAVGDLDGDGRPDLVLGAGANGLGNFRVLQNSVVTSSLAIEDPAAYAAGIAEQLGAAGKFAQPRAPGSAWKPTGGPDFFTPGDVTGPTGSGFNAPLSVVVVPGTTATGGKAQLFAALGSGSLTPNTVRRFTFTESDRWTSDAAFSLLSGTPGSPRFRHGDGIRLG